MDGTNDSNEVKVVPKRKRVANGRVLLTITIVMMMADMCIIALHPAYRDYKRMEKKLGERILSFENGFKKEYINAVLEVASEIKASRTNIITSGAVSPLAPQGLRNVREDSPYNKPIDLTRGDYRFFVVGNATGFSLGGSLVFRVGDSFLGRRIVSADKFGAVLEDGGLIRNGEIARSETKTKGGIDDKRTN